MAAQIQSFEIVLESQEPSDIHQAYDRLVKFLNRIGMNSGSDLGFPWNELGLAPTREVSEIRSAYARRLKTIDISREPEAFQALRRAYEAALVAAANEAQQTAETTGEERPARDEAPPDATKRDGAADLHQRCRDGAAARISR